jgi:hypothetical protein
MPQFFRILARICSDVEDEIDIEPFEHLLKVKRFKLKGNCGRIRSDDSHVQGGFNKAYEVAFNRHWPSRALFDSTTAALAWIRPGR